MNNTIQESQRYPVFNIIDYGVVKNQEAPNTAVIQAASNACSQAGGGTVYVPADQYVTGSILFKSNIAGRLRELEPF